MAFLLRGENPAWTDRIIRENEPRIRARAERERLPMPVCKATRAAQCRQYESYGEGHYGVTLKTERPGVVFKITSDPTEASFIAIARKLYEDGVDPEGLVKYYGVWAIESSSRRNRPVYAVWREEANYVGQAKQAWFDKIVAKSGIPEDEMPTRERLGEVLWNEWLYAKRVVHSFERTLQAYNWAARRVRTIASRHWNNDREKYFDWMDDQLAARERYGDLWSEHYEKGIPGVPEFLKRRYSVMWDLMSAEQWATELTNEVSGYLMGQALYDYLERGILLADVHTGNLGVATSLTREEPDVRSVIITDPGHAVPLDRKWAKVEIETLS